MKEKIISRLTINKICQEHDLILCPNCNNHSKPVGLGQKSNNKIQLIRKCRSCEKLFWYWINYKSALIPFSET